MGQRKMKLMKKGRKEKLKKSKVGIIFPFD
jgi:hypothetical protein